MNRLTGRGPVLGLLLAAGVGGLLASAQPWFSAIGGPPGGADDTVTFTGADATGGLTQALASVVLAGVLLTLVLAARGRRVLAVLLVLCGVGMTLLGVLRTAPTDAAVRTRFRQVSLAEEFSVQATGWPWLYAIAGLLAIGGSVLLWVGAPRWVQRGRFERTAPRSRPDAADDPAGAWRALDAGIDPTHDPIVDDPADSADPHVQSGAAEDTMGEGQSQPSRRQDGEQ